MGGVGVPEHQWLGKAALGPCACVHVFVGPRAALVLTLLVPGGRNEAVSWERGGAPAVHGQTRLAARRPVRVAADPVSS